MQSPGKINVADLPQEELLKLIGKFQRKVTKQQQQLASGKRESETTATELKRKIAVLQTDEIRLNRKYNELARAQEELQKTHALCAAKLSKATAAAAKDTSNTDGNPAQKTGDYNSAFTASLEEKLGAISLDNKTNLDKLQAANAQLTKAFRLLQSEKNAKVDAEKSLKDMTEILSREREKNAEVLRTQQQILSQKTSQNATLHNEISELERKLLVFEGDRDDMTRRERKIAVASEETRQVRQVLDRERQLRDQERQQRELELEIEREERLKEREQLERERLKMQREKQQASAEVEAQRKKVVVEQAELRASGEEMRDRCGAVEIALKKEKSISAALKSEVRGLLGARELSSKRFDAVKQEVLAVEKGKYKTLEKDFGEFKLVKETELKDLTEEVSVLQERVMKLTEQLDNGHPEERRIIELAQLQARRDGHVRHAADREQHLKTQLRECKRQIELDQEAKQYLQTEIRRLGQSEKRGDVNIDYLKDVIVKYMCFERRGPTEELKKQALLPAITRLLHFTADDLQLLKRAQQHGDQTNKGIWTSFWGKKDTQTSSSSALSSPLTIPRNVALADVPSTLLKTRK